MAEGKSGNPPAWAVAAVFLAAWSVRVGMAVFLPNIHHLDEVFQTLEQAHRVVFGYGFVPWEFEHAVRSWLLPGFIAGIMQASRLLGEGPHVYLPFVAAALSAIGAAAVTCVYLKACRLFGPALGLVAAAIPAFAPELLFFAGKGLTEVVGGHLLIVAACLAFPGSEPRSNIPAAVAGFLTALAVAIRLQVAPAAALIALAALLQWRIGRVLWLIGGGAAAVVIAGTVDWLTWGTPFLSYWHNFQYNILYGVSSHFGIKPWFEYPALMIVVFGGALVAILLFSSIGARFDPLLAGIAIAILVAHQPIGHKEFRFLYPALFAMEALAGFGLAASLRWLGQRGILNLLPGSHWPLRWRTAAAWGLFGVALLGRVPSLMIMPGNGSAWIEKRDRIAAAIAVSRLSGVCGIGGYGIRWGEAGYIHTHQPVPFHEARNREELVSRQRSFNTLIFDSALQHSLSPEFTTADGTPPICFGQRCIAQRSGSCEPRAVEALDLPPQLNGVARVTRLWPPPASGPVREGLPAPHVIPEAGAAPAREGRP